MTFPPTIMLHHIGDDQKYNDHKPYSITKRSFVLLLDYLEKNGITTKDFYSWTAQSSSIFSKQVMITIDDCYRHLLDFAIPELQRRSMKAIFYMPTAHIGGLNDWDILQGKTKVEIMNESELKDVASSGFEIGVHSHNHIALDSISKDEVVKELSMSKDILSGITSQPIVSMAWPFGRVPENYAQILKSVGLKFGMGIYHPKGDRYAIRRFIYHDQDNEKSLAQKMSLSYRIYRAIKG